MDMQDLTLDERMVLIHLVAQMIGADSDTTPEELEEIQALAEEMGHDSFSEAVSAARHKSLTEVLAYAKVVERDDAWQLIRTVLIDIAAVDGVSIEEARIIDNVETIWGMQKG